MINEMQILAAKRARHNFFAILFFFFFNIAAPLPIV